MKLNELIAGENIYRWQKDVEWDKEIRSVMADSRKVETGDVFIALKGEYHDGHHYTAQALQRGACALILENEAYCLEGEPWILVKDTHELFGIMEQNLAGRPSLRMNVIGVTGTNGKTTVTHMLAGILEEAGMKVGLLGTIGNRIGGRMLGTELTTQGSAELAELFRQMAEEETDYAIMEVSSHALALSRTAGIEFDMAVFTNLTQDHLDFHQNMGEYLNAKSKLFSGLKPQGEKDRKKAAIINLDDQAGATLADYCRVPVITYGLGSLCHLRAEDVALSPAGIGYRLVYGSETYEIKLRLHGRFNVYNSMAAIAAALVEGVSMPVISRALYRMPPVPGRFQQVADPGEKLPFQIFVDYSHTPDSLENCISTAREICRGRVISVFGAGGHRDAAKRPLMGEIAARLSDVAIVTSDNPRDEEPMAIIGDILKGMGGLTAKASVMTEPERGKAIALAVSLAQPGDMVLICGKGHEDYQIIGDTKYPFDDYEEAQKSMDAIANRGGQDICRTMG